MVRICERSNSTRLMTEASLKDHMTVCIFSFPESCARYDKDIDIDIFLENRVMQLDIQFQVSVGNVSVLVTCGDGIFLNTV